MKNTLLDMHNILMEQLERLNEDDLSAEQLDKEITRSKGMSQIANCIVQNSNIMLKATELSYDMGNTPEMNTLLLGSNDAKSKTVK